MIFRITFISYYVVCAMMQMLLYCYVGERLTFEVPFIKEKLISWCFFNKNFGFTISILDVDSLITYIKVCNFPEYRYSWNSIWLRMVQSTTWDRKVTYNYYVSSESITVETYCRQILLVHYTIVLPSK